VPDPQPRHVGPDDAYIAAVFNDPPVLMNAVLRGYGLDDELVTEHPLGQALTVVLGADLVCRAGDLMWFLEYDRA
jgi:hypothetical protein